MKSIALFAMFALIPAAFNPQPAAAQIAVLVCVDGKDGGTITIPLRPASPLRGEGEGCCVKGCHAGPSRKRGSSCHG